jgi:hypothetical protein
MPLRTCVKPVGTLTVRLLGEQKMTDNVKIHEEIHEEIHKRYAQHLAEAMGHTIGAVGAVGAIPDRRVYSSIPLSNPWTNVNKNTWEIEVDFHD